jgi:hypothetical protein
MNPAVRAAVLWLVAVSVLSFALAVALFGGEDLVWLAVGVLLAVGFVAVPVSVFTHRRVRDEQERFRRRHPPRKP